MKLPFDSCILDACKGCVKHLLLSAVLDGKGGKKWLWGFLQNQIIASENLQENCLFFFPYKYFSFYAGEKKNRQQNNLCRLLASFIFYAKRKQMRSNHSKMAEGGSSKLGVGWGKHFSSACYHPVLLSVIPCNAFYFYFFIFPLSELCLSLLLAPLITIMSPRPSPATSHACWAASLLLRAANNAFLILACVSTLEAGN